MTTRNPIRRMDNETRVHVIIMAAAAIGTLLMTSAAMLVIP